MFENSKTVFGAFPIRAGAFAKLSRQSRFSGSSTPKTEVSVENLQACTYNSVRSSWPPVFPVGYPNKKMYVPWVPKIAHKSLIPGQPTGRLPPHPTVTGQKISVYVPFPFLSCMPKIFSPSLKDNRFPRQGNNAKQSASKGGSLC